MRKKRRCEEEEEAGGDRENRARRPTRGWRRERGCTAPRQTGGGVDKRGTGSGETQAARRYRRERDKVRGKSADKRSTGGNDDNDEVDDNDDRMIDVTASKPRATSSNVGQLTGRV